MRAFLLHRGGRPVSRGRCAAEMARPHLHLLLRRGLLRAAPSGTTGGKRAVWFHGAGIGNGAPARQHGVLLPSARAGQCPVKTTGGSSSKTGPSLSLAVYLPVSPWHPCIPNVEWVT